MQAKVNWNKNIKVKANYWNKRKNSIYLRYVDYIVCALSEESTSIIDIGSKNCPYLEWFPWFTDRASLDLDRPYAGAGTRSIKADFLEWVPDRRYDVALCLQVLEHVPAVEAFSAKLLTVANHVIVTVPHKWKEDTLQQHVHDPIDRKKFESWFPRKPDYCAIAREPLSRNRLGERIVAYFDNVNPNSGRIFRKRKFAKQILLSREPVTFTP